MRTRMLVVLAVLAVLTTTIFAVPLALERAQSRTQQLILDRTADAQRFADLASNYVIGGSETNSFAEMTAYTRLYGEPVVVVATGGAPALNTGIELSREDVNRALSGATRNEPASDPIALTPFGADSMLVALPIGADSQVSGAVLIEASTLQAKADIAKAWSWIALGSVLALVVFGGIAQLLSRWILRPLFRMNQRIEQMRDSLPFITRSALASTEHTESAGPAELRTVSQTLDSMNSALHASTVAQRRLVADTAHQLRNPMAALQLRLDLLQATQSAEQVESAAQAQYESRRLNALLDELLLLARAESLSLGAEQRTAVDLLEAVQERVGNWRPTVEGSGGSVQCHGPAAPLTVQISLPTLQQYLDIMLDNAAKYAAGAAVTVTVEPGVDRVQVKVADQGPGVEDSQISRITERFYRGAPSTDRSESTTAGSGLGLAIAEALAQAMDATLTFTHSQPHGLTATLGLPKYAQDLGQVQP